MLSDANLSPVLLKKPAKNLNPDIVVSRDADY